jgi:hypothetical protein
MESLVEIARRVSKKYGGKVAVTVAVFATSDGRVSCCIHINEYEIAFTEDDDIESVLARAEMAACDT